VLPDDPQQRRDLGASLLHSGHPGQAVEEFEAYLNATPQAADTDSVNQLLRKARSEIARWN
jgi:regulator of sirC expression with transglutaminase-like and TPR domain